MKIQRSLKTTLIILGSMGLTSLGLLASDLTQGIDGRLVGLVSESGTGLCGAGALVVQVSGRALCVDIFEASPATQCPFGVTDNAQATQANVQAAACQAVSAAERMPWRYVTYTQAQQLCARGGKRLPTNEEWYKIALSLADTSTCTLTSASREPALTGAGCTTPHGVADVVGNVWEWMDETMTDGRYADRQLPDSGYVALVDGAGIVIETADAAQAQFGNDYAWVDQTGVRGFLRGGFYASGEDGGVFAQNMSVALDFNSVGVGFRCVRDI